MIFTQFNIITIFVFIIIFLLNIFFCYLNFKNINKNPLLNNNVKLNKKKFTLLLSFIFILVTVNIFWIKWKMDNLQEDWISSNVLFLLDVSKSMNVKDVVSEWLKVSRLRLSKEYIIKYINKYPYNNYALSIFAWESLRVIPFTKDISIFKTLLMGVTERSLSVYWTDFNIALKESIKTFKQNEKSWLIVLISDIWENSWFSSLPNLPKDIKSFIIWVWTEKWGFIPLWRDIIWKTRVRIYNSKKVISKLIIKNLDALWFTLNSKYVILDNSNLFNNTDLEILSEVERTNDKNNLNKRYDYTRSFIMISLLLFVFSLFYLWRKK